MGLECAQRNLVESRGRSLDVSRPRSRRSAHSPLAACPERAQILIQKRSVNIFFLVYFSRAFYRLSFFSSSPLRHTRRLSSLSAVDCLDQQIFCARRSTSPPLLRRGDDSHLTSPDALPTRNSLATHGRLVCLMKLFLLALLTARRLVATSRLLDSCCQHTSASRRALPISSLHASKASYFLLVIAHGKLFC